ncbi:hypothetical protein SEA_ELEPHANTOON_87 [Mycobacterium phage Elephantoon]|nr:hypothetical protein SEA_ELEPHANTOON_87 [Mycobacterium phage Elephantoon]
MTGLVSAVVLGHAPGIVAEASSAPLCEVRSDAHVAEHGGLTADSSYHIQHGELPTCNGSEQTARQGDESRDNDRDNKSRYCRKHWYC